MKKSSPNPFTTRVRDVDEKTDQYPVGDSFCMAGSRIYSLDRLALAAEKKLSVVCPSSGIWVKPRPAAFVIHLSGYILNRMINAGMFIYRKGSNGKF